MYSQQMDEYPLRLYRFRVMNKPAGHGTGRPGRVFTTSYRLTEAEAHERYVVVEKLVETEDVVWGPSGHTSDYLRNRSQADEGWSLQSDDLPEIDFDL